MTSDTSTIAGSASESLVSRIFVAPVLFISFVISLFLIDRQTYAKVLNGHDSKNDYYHSNQRKMAKQEMNDAFHLRNRVIAAILVICGLGLALLSWTGSKAYHALFPDSRYATI